MRVAFAGTPDFAACALKAILAAGHAVPLVLTQPDRRAGRGMALQPGPVKQLALRHALALHQPASLKAAEAQQPLRAAAADVLVVAAYGLILPQALLDIPPMGCINIHASLLPRWRGAAPIQRAILAGDAETGVTIMQMDAGLDTGPMLLRASIPIGDSDTTLSLHDKLAALGAAQVVEALRRLAAGGLVATPQPAEGITYAAKIDKHEAELDWRRPALELERAVRAFDPFPVAAACVFDAPLKIWRARAETGSGAPGEILSADGKGIVVGCGAGVLRLLQLQRPGGKRLDAGDFLRGFALKAGLRFALPPD